MAKRTNPDRPKAPPADEEPSAPVGGPTPLELALEEHKSKFTFIVVGAVLVVSAFFVFRYLGQKKEEDAAIAYTAATTVEEFEAVTNEHAGTIAGGNAYLRAADLLINGGKNGEALAGLETFVTTYEGHPRLPQGLFSIASIRHTQGEFDQAEIGYQKLLDEYPSSDLAPYAQLRIGDIAWERGDTDKAGQIYSSIPPNYPATALVGGEPSRVEERLRMIREEPPTEPSERQKKAVEEAEKKAAEAAAKQAEDAKNAALERETGAPSIPGPSRPIVVPPLAPPDDVATPPVEDTSQPDDSQPDDNPAGDAPGTGDEQGAGTTTTPVPEADPIQDGDTPQDGGDEGGAPQN